MEVVNLNQLIWNSSLSSEEKQALDSYISGLERAAAQNGTGKVCQFCHEGLVPACKLLIGDFRSDHVYMERDELVINIVPESRTRRMKVKYCLNCGRKFESGGLGCQK